MDDSTIESSEEKQYWSGYHHARVHEADVVYHIVSRTYQGRWLLTPAEDFNDIVAGVLGRAQTMFSSIRLYGYAFLTNHFHLVIRGAPKEVPSFVAYVKREISVRWGEATGWTDGVWADSYKSTALPTDVSQIDCLRYVLSHGVKEGIVDVPERWPGVHVAHQLFEGLPLVGRLLHGTAHAKAAYKDKARRSPRGVDASEYMQEYPVRVDRLPAFAALTDGELAAALQLLRASILVDRPRKKPPSSSKMRQLKTRQFNRTTELEPPPWLTARRRMICWAAHDAPETKAYLSRYWERQLAFREAAKARRAAADTFGFPRDMHSSGRFEDQQAGAAS